MEIQHRKLINAKFFQYLHQVSNAHAQHKKGLGSLDSNRILMGFFAVYGSSYSLFESNWNHDVSYLFVMQISPFIVLLS